VQYVVSLLFASICYFLITRLVFFNIPCLFAVLFGMCFIFCVFCVFVLFCVLFLRLCITVNFLLFLEIYRPLALRGNSIAVIRLIMYIISNILPLTLYVNVYQVMQFVATFKSHEMINCEALIPGC